MTVTQGFRKPAAMTRAYLYIDGRTQADFRGTAVLCGGGGEFRFGGMVEMLAGLESVFNRMGTPQPTFDIRGFDAMPKAVSPMKTGGVHMDNPDCNREHEKKATFLIQVRFRQNATWQGEIKWVGRDKVQYFRSSLEMIKLMDAALNSEFGEEVEIRWE